MNRCPNDQQLFRVVIFSNFKSWIENFPNSTINDLGGYFIARKPLPGQASSYRIENAFSQFEARRKIRSNLILLGLLYGGDGQDLKPVLRFDTSLIAFNLLSCYILDGYGREISTWISCHL